MKKSLIFGVGVNDADYPVTNTSKANVRLWTCDYYSRWHNMLRRCYSEKFKQKTPSYIGVRCCEEWHIFSNFKAWMETQNWIGLCLDKDILIEGNQVYGPDACIFVPQQVNKFITEKSNRLTDLPLGVTKHNSGKNPYKAQLKDLLGKKINIGYFKTPEEAYRGWIAAKLNLLKELDLWWKTDKMVSDSYNLTAILAIKNRYDTEKMK